MLLSVVFSNSEASGEIDNLTNDGTWSYSWQHGRQLKQMSRPDDSGETEMIRFRYDSSGHRIGKDSGIYHISYSGGEIVYAGETTPPISRFRTRHPGTMSLITARNLAKKATAKLVRNTLYRMILKTWNTWSS